MKFNQSNIKKAKKYLDKDCCIGIPTETVYGLAANAYSNRAVNKIYKMKKRPKSNPLIVHYSDIKKLKKDCLINDNFLKLYRKFSPGPITYILNLKNDSKISKIVTNKKNNLAVRFPKHKILKKLLNKLNYPVAAPSANISSRLSAVQASDVKEDFCGKVKYILDGGKCNIGLESTIIDLRNKPKILRLGGLEISKIEKILGKKIEININSKKKVAPGQSRLHYSPGIPLRMNIKKSKKNEAFILLKENKKTYSNYFYLSKKNNLKEAAKNLYSLLRKIKNKGYKSIAVAKIQNFGIGRTINDRLKRASKF
jgi:L-threonylcarbamoyladenylate synthase